MEKIDYRMWIALGIHTLICLIQLAQPEIFLFYFTLPFVLLNVVGIILIISDKVKAGAIVFMIGSFAFIPIGIIGIIGARSILNKLKQKDFFSEINTIGNENN